MKELENTSKNKTQELADQLKSKESELASVNEKLSEVINVTDQIKENFLKFLINVTKQLKTKENELDEATLLINTCGSVETTSNELTQKLKAKIAELDTESNRLKLIVREADQLKEGFFGSYSVLNREIKDKDVEIDKLNQQLKACNGFVDDSM